MDAFAERDIVDTLRQAAAKRTTLTIAHRLSSITHCDKIIVMDKGMVVEQVRACVWLNVRVEEYVCEYSCVCACVCVCAERIEGA